MRHYYLLFAALFVAIVMSAQNGKISPYLNQLVIQQQETAAARGTATHIRSITALTKLSDDADETALTATYGFTVNARIGRVLVVSIPLSQVEAMAADPQVLRIEAERTPRPLLDRVPQQIGADKAHAGLQNDLPQAFTGKDVIVGIVDAGFDYVNPFFRDANGTTRVTWAGDYMNNTKLTTTAEITAAMHSSDAATMLHGTHVAGIAAGSQVNDINDVEYRGIACEADIAEGAVDSEITAYGLSSASSIQAFSDIFAYAEEQGKPCVINYSMGEAMSFSDHRQLEEEAISTLLEKPGRALVVAAGNSGSTSRLAHKEASMASAGAGVCFNDFEQYGTYFGVELKMKPAQTLQLTYYDSTYKNSKGQMTKTAQQLESLTKVAFANKQFYVQFRGQTADGYDIIYVTAEKTTFPITDRILVTIQGEGEAWIYADALCAQLENVADFENHAIAQAGYSMTWPAQMEEVVSVGNIAQRLMILTSANKYSGSGPTDLTPYESTKGEGYLAKSSSEGPTLSGSMKPDVCAPGVNIVSAYNNFVNENTDMEYAAWLVSILDTEYEPEYGGYFVTLAQTGTSMSAPAVTGTIALWMQADPTLTTDRIKEVIAHSALQPDEELTYPNNQYGYGEVDAYKGLLYLLGLNKIEGISANMPLQGSIRLKGRQLHIAFANAYQGDFTVRIYATNGKLLQSVHNQSVVDLSTLPQGVFAVQVTTNEKATTGSTLIRL